MKRNVKEILFVFATFIIIFFGFGSFLLYANATTSSYNEKSEEVESDSPTRMNEEQEAATRDKVKTEITDPINEDINRAVDMVDKTSKEITE